MVKNSAPEVIQSFDNVSMKSDIWSLGIVFYSLFSQTHPFEATSIWDVKSKIDKFSIAQDNYF